MKKLLIYSMSGLGILFSSCQISFWTVVKYSPEIVKELSYVSKEQRMKKKEGISYYYGKKFPFVFDNGGIFIPCKINDTTHLVFYNTDGSAFNINFVEQIPGNLEFPKTNKTVKERTTERSVKIKKGLKYYNIESDFFDFKQYVGRLESISNDSIVSECMPKSNENRFRLGTDAFPKGNDIMLLSFSDTTITLLDSLGQYDTTGFTTVQSDFRCIGLVVDLTVNGIKDKFFFRTDNKDFLTMQLYKKHKKESDVSVNYIKRNDANNLVIDTLIVQQTNTIKFGDLDSMEGNIYYKKIDRPIMGMAFISQFDWIIDMNKGKMYAKKIKEIEHYSNHYQVNVFDSTLRISSLPVGETEYQLFSIIDSVNGEKVTMENICQMSELLNKPNGFKENEMVILPPPAKEIILKK